MSNQVWRWALACALMVAVWGAVPAAAQGPSSYGPVGNETLWSVARKLSQNRAGSTAQIAWALYRANPEAFDGSPSRVRPRATLRIPDNAFINSVPAAQAYAYLTGAATPPAATAAPAAPATVASVAPPVVSKVELAPPQPGEPYQWLTVLGSGFAADAVLELRDPAEAAATTRNPQSVRAGRIEYAAPFPERAALWQVVVRNPDGRRSAPFPFTAVAGVAPAPPPVSAAGVAPPAGAFAGSADQKIALEMEGAGQGADAVYRFLEPREEVYAGDVDFDYLLGARALDSGRYSQAIFVLQRAVATRPGFAGARMELARAYYAQGDNESARREFAILEKDNPPPQARRAIAEYMAAIDRRAAVYQSQLGGYAELATGYDSNANGSPELQTFIGIPLDVRNQSTASGFYSLGVGGLVSRPLAPSWRLVGTGGASYRGNPDASFVDSQVLRLAGGVEWRPSQLEFALLPSFGYAMLDGEDNHQVIGVDGSGTWHFDQARLSLNLRHGQTRYAEGLETLDVDTLIYGIAAQYTTLTMPRIQVVSAVTAGSDDAVDPASQFSRDITGLRVNAVADFGGGHALLVSIASVSADYDGIFFGQVRSDDQLGGTLGYEWGGWRATGWVLRAQLNYTDNSSNVALYDYDRVDAGVSVRKEFR